MLKVLVSDKNLQENQNCCEYLANDKSIDVVSAYSGVETLNKYYEIKPDVLVINSDFDDISYNEIINQLCSTSRERNNSNIIITLKNEKICLDFAAKIYQLYYFPVNFKKIKTGIDYYKIDHHISVNPTDENLDALFYQLHILNDLSGAKYLKFAIMECYKHPKLKKSLNQLYEKTSNKYKISVSAVRSSMRHALKSLNSYRDNIGNIGILSLFEDEDYITPKTFINILTNYYLQSKKRD